MHSLTVLVEGRGGIDVRNYQIGVIPGDGIGPEVVTEGLKVLKSIERVDSSLSFTFTEFPWGCEYYLKNGIMMDDDGIERLSKTDAIYLGAVGYPGVDRKSTRLNSSHVSISYAVFCLKKK